MLINTYLPEKILTNEDLHMQFPDWDYAQFEKKVGINSRHIAGKDETATDMAVEAAKPLVAEYGEDSIDFVLFCTQSPDYFLPTSACVIQEQLGLSTNCGALDINLGCSGFVYGLSIAKGLLCSGTAESVLFIVSETYSKHLHPKDRTNRSIFGDAASATIISKDDAEKIGTFVLKTDGTGASKLIVKNGAFRFPFSADAEEISYGAGNVYTDNHLYMNGPDIFSFTIENIPKLIDETLQKNKLEKEDIDLYIFHQANKFMLNTLRKLIKVPKEKFYINMNDTGNTVSATIPIALQNAISEGLVSSGSKVLIAGFGVGLSWGATIISL